MPRPKSPVSRVPPQRAPKHAAAQETTATPAQHLVTVTVSEVDVEDGSLWATPSGPAAAGSALPTRIRLRSATSAPLTYAIGQRLIARLTPGADDDWVGHVIRPVGPEPARVIGIVEHSPRGRRLRPADPKLKAEFHLSGHHLAGARHGELVVVEPLPGARAGTPQARVLQRLGPADAPRTVSLIAIHERGIPLEFSAAALSEASELQPVRLGQRRDLRPLPLVTIDGSDARDFDDAVFAEPDPSPENRGGFRLVVTIADVAAYVRPGSALDAEARQRGNSVYFPDRVVPMLPERLSNNLCSLRPAEERACIAVELRINAEGRLLRHEFVRGMMRSVARLTYEQVQAAHDGHRHDLPEGLTARVIQPLYGAFAALAQARRQRGTIDLDLEERLVQLAADGTVAGIVPRQRLDSHRLIEEFMIAANIAAAMSVQARRTPALFRIHDPPDPIRVDALRLTLASFGYRLAKGQVLRPRHFGQILAWAAGTPREGLINDLVLRTQAKAVYSPDNRGHFGLALRDYAHFTSPIRRYADLVLHRALLHATGLDSGGGRPSGHDELVELGEHLSATERRAAAAERTTVDRFVAMFLVDRTGAEFAGRISGVERFGLFVTLAELGADGLVPISSLGDDYYVHEPASQRLVGRRSGRSYRLGDPVMVRLDKADPLSGRLSFQLADGGSPGRFQGPPARPDPRRQRQRATR